MKTVNLFIVPVVIGCFIFSCHTTDSNANEEIEKASINSSEIFEYHTGIQGVEELATIVQQPEHYEISKIVRDSTTQWEAVYRYKPESGFEGTVQTKLKTATGSDGASPNTDFKFLIIEITVN